MIIKNEKEYKDYETRVEQLILKGTELGDMELLGEDEKAEFTMLNEALSCFKSTYVNSPYCTNIVKCAK